MKRLSLILLFFGLSISCFSFFFNEYSGSTSTLFTACVPIDNGGFMCTGYVEEEGSSPGPTEDGVLNDIIAVKLDDLGSIAWQKTYGGSDDDFAYSILPTSDGGFLVVGETKSLGASLTDALIFKVDSSGNVVWTKLFGGPQDDYAIDAKEDDNGNYLILGGTNSGGSGEDVNNYHIFLLGLTPNGKYNFAKVYESDGEDYPYQLFKTKEGNFLIVGTTRNLEKDNFDALVIKIDAGGIIEWQKFYGNNLNNYFYFATESKDGGFIFVGETSDLSGSESRGFAVRTDKKGGDLWQKSFGYGKKSFLNGVKPIQKHGFVIVGGEIGEDGDYDAFAIKIDWAGNILWSKSYEINGDEVLYGVKLNRNKTILLYGVSNSNSVITSFLINSDKQGGITSCSAIKDGFVNGKKYSSGSGIANLSLATPTLTLTKFDGELEKIPTSVTTFSVCE